MIPTRNDGYGKIDNYTLNDRAIFCINSAIKEYDEVILVDWNSPTHPLLWDIKDCIEFKGNLKHIIIQPEIAKVLTNNDPDAAVCCEVLSRNIGIRKLINTMDWVISTNIDIIAPKRNELEELIIDKLDQNTFYTISRRPVDWSIISKFFKDNNIQHRNEKDLSFKDWPLLRDFLTSQSEERHYVESVVKGDDYSIVNCCGDFQLAHKHVWTTIKGFEEDLIYVLYSDTNVQKKAKMHGFGLKALYSPPLFHINHGKGGGGFLDGINKKVNDINRAVIFQHYTQNEDTWGFSNIEIEYETM